MKKKMKKQSYEMCVTGPVTPQ